MDNISIPPHARKGFASTSAGRAVEKHRVAEGCLPGDKGAILRLGQLWRSHRLCAKWLLSVTRPSILCVDGAAQNTGCRGPKTLLTDQRLTTGLEQPQPSSHPWDAHQWYRILYPYLSSCVGARLLAGMVFLGSFHGAVDAHYHLDGGL